MKFPWRKCDFGFRYTRQDNLIGMNAMQSINQTTGRRARAVREEVGDDGEIYFYANPYTFEGDGKYIDKNGNRVKGYMLDMVGTHLGPRTKQTNPYSYDALLQWKKYDKTPENASAVYSDRMLQWDYTKFRSLCREHFNHEGDYFGGRSPKKIEAFMRAYFGNPDLELVRIEEHCNQSSGYPVWAFFYVDPNRKEPEPRQPVVAKAIPAKEQPAAPSVKVQAMGWAQPRAGSMRAKARRIKVLNSVR